MRLRFVHLLIVVVLVGCSSNRRDGFGDDRDLGAREDGGGQDAQAPDTGLRDLGPPAPGSPCAGPTECGPNALCIGKAEGGFACMATCSVPYDLCVDGSVCLPVMSGNAAVCYLGGGVEQSASCTSNLDCASGNLCFGADGEFYCRPACDERDGCRGGEYCLRLASGAGFCREEVGAPCPGADCAQGLECSTSMPEVASIFASGYCTRPCSVDLECPGDAVCVKHPSSPDVAVCFDRCGHDSECRFNAGFRCMGAENCSGSGDPEGCEQFFGEDRFCLDSTP